MRYNVLDGGVSYVCKGHQAVSSISVVKVRLGDELAIYLDI